MTSDTLKKAAERILDRLMTEGAIELKATHRFEAREILIDGIFAAIEEVNEEHKQNLKNWYK